MNLEIYKSRCVWASAPPLAHVCSDHGQIFVHSMSLLKYLRSCRGFNRGHENSHGEHWYEVARRILTVSNDMRSVTTTALAPDNDNSPLQHWCEQETFRSQHLVCREPVPKHTGIAVKCCNHAEQDMMHDQWPCVHVLADLQRCPPGGMSHSKAEGPGHNHSLWLDHHIQRLQIYVELWLPEAT